MIYIFTPEFYEINGGIKTCVDEQLKAININDIPCKIYSLDKKQNNWALLINIFISMTNNYKIHVHGAYFLIIFSILGSIFRKKNIKLYFHGSEIEFIKANNPLAFKIFSFLVKRFGSNIEMLFVSKFLHKKVIDIFNIDTKLVKTNVCYFGPKYRSKSAYKPSFYSKKKPIKLLTVSRIDNRKGIFEMLNVFRDLSNLIDVEWTIIGGGPEENLLKIRIKQMDDLKINFLGRLPSNKLGQYYCSSDIFWLCSLYEEGLGLVYLEAAAFDLPSIGIKFAGVEEAISHLKTGILINSVDDTLKAITDIRNKNFLSSDFKSFLAKRRNFTHYLDN